LYHFLYRTIFFIFLVFDVPVGTLRIIIIIVIVVIIAIMFGVEK